MTITGKAVREAARRDIAAFAAAVERYDLATAATIGERLVKHLAGALDTADALAEDVRELVPDVTVGFVREDLAGVRKARADLVAFDGPGAERVSRAEVIEALRNMDDHNGCQCLACADRLRILARIDAEGGTS